jgi:hypothetical protein
LEGLAAAIGDEAQRLSMPELMKAYPREASIHRNMLLRRGTGMSPDWRDFRVFLRDLGPCPDQTHVLGFTQDHDVTYAPGRARWMAAEEAAAQDARLAEVAQRSLAEAAAADWRRNPKKSSVLPPRAVAKPAEEAKPRAAVAKTSALSLINEESDWLPADPDRRGAFLKVYQAWHSQVLAQYSSAATPAFLFVFSALPVLKSCRSELESQDLWDPLTDRGTSAKEAHPAWRKYCEFLPRAVTALNEIGTYSDYSVFTQLDDLIDRVVKAEQRFRTGPEKRVVATPQPQMRARPAG